MSSCTLGSRIITIEKSPCSCQFLRYWIIQSHIDICFSRFHSCWPAEAVQSDHTRNSFFLKCVFTWDRMLTNRILSRAELALQQLFCFRWVHSSISHVGGAASDPAAQHPWWERGLGAVLFYGSLFLPVCPCTKRGHTLSPVWFDTTCYFWCMMRCVGTS